MTEYQTSSAYGRVGEPWWSEVWIVAGGSSALHFRMSRLVGKTVVAINDAYTLMSIRQMRGMDHLVLFSADPDWARGHRRLLQFARGERYLAVPLDAHPDLADIPGVTYLRRSHESGLSEDPASLTTGGNSGYAAIALAYLKHATDVHLVGFDMDPADGDKYDQWIPRFRSMAPQLMARGVRVTNHNPDSFIDAFPKEQ